MHESVNAIYLHLPLPPELDVMRYVVTDWDDGLKIYLINDAEAAAESHRSSLLNLTDIFSWYKNDAGTVRLFCEKIPELALATALRSPVFQLDLLKAIHEIGDLSHLSTYPILLAMIGEMFETGDSVTMAHQIRSLPAGQVAQYMLTLADEVDESELRGTLRSGDIEAYYDIKNRIIENYG